MKLSNFPDLMLKEPDSFGASAGIRMENDSTLSCMESLEDGISWWTVSFTNSNFGCCLYEDKWSSRSSKHCREPPQRVCYDDAFFGPACWKSAIESLI